MALRTEAIWCSFYLLNQCSVLPGVLCLRVPDGEDMMAFSIVFFLGVKRKVPVFVIVHLECDFFLFACSDWSALRMGLINGELTLPNLCSPIHSLTPVGMSRELCALYQRRAWSTLNSRHMGPVPNGCLHVDLQSCGLLWCVSVKSTRPYSVPFVILGYKNVLMRTFETHPKSTDRI